MWLGVAAGLALLTWFTVFLPAVFASQTTFNDQGLSYNGEGWQNTQSPQICQQVSPTMRSTSTLGDSVNFTFSGTGVIVWGPVTSTSLPVVVVLDDAVQPLATPQGCTGGCGIIYANGDLANTSHTISVLLPQASGTTTLNICGITITNFSQSIQSPPTISSTSTASPTSEPSPPPIGTTAFVTTRGMIIAIIGAIAGVIAAMSVLLYVFIRVRRRITRQAARSRDRENSFDREARDQETKHSFSILSSYGGDSKSNSIVIQPGLSRTRASTVSVVSTHRPFSIHAVSGLSPNLVQSSRMLSIYTERSVVTQDFTFVGLFPGTPTETDNIFVYSSQSEENPLVSNRSSSILSRLSIPIALFSPHRRPSSSPSSSMSAVFPRNSHISDASAPFSTPRASRIRILPRDPIISNSEGEHGSGSHTGSGSSQTHHIQSIPPHLTSII